MREFKRVWRDLKQATLGTPKALVLACKKPVSCLAQDRLYFGVHEDYLIFLLTGGDKGSQKTDIKRAQQYWRKFLEGTHGKAKQ